MILEQASRKRKEEGGRRKVQQERGLEASDEREPVPLVHCRSSFSFLPCCNAGERPVRDSDE